MSDEAGKLRSRRRALTWLAGALPAPRALAQATDSSPPITPFARVAPGYRVRFPRDDGSHPAFRIEWWYVTGWLAGALPALGFQVTFFRVRPRLARDNPSSFAPRQIVIAHAALSDPARGRLMHDQRAARVAFELAGAAETGTAVWIGDWSLRRENDFYRARIAGQDFSFELRLRPTQPPLLQGQEGYSRKGPEPGFASYYYSLPQLECSGTVSHDRVRAEFSGTAWLDHEWSSNYLDPRAAGWDWIGINLSDGGALMAFRMRRTQGGEIWREATLRGADGRRLAYTGDQVRFTARRDWTSARTGVRYPVAWSIRVGGREFEIEPLFDDQENDTRATTGAIYWEGAVRAYSGGKLAGRGYLELTGYEKPLTL